MKNKKNPFQSLYLLVLVAQFLFLAIGLLVIFTADNVDATHKFLLSVLCLVMPYSMYRTIKLL